MNSHHPSMSLIDVLMPPANQWLRELSKSKADLPAGVRVVRFNNDDDEACDKTEGVASSTRPKRAAQTVAAS